MSHFETWVWDKERKYVDCYSSDKQFTTWNEAIHGSRFIPLLYLKDCKSWISFKERDRRKYAKDLILYVLLHGRCEKFDIIDRDAATKWLHIFEQLAAAAVPAPTQQKVYKGGTEIIRPPLEWAKPTPFDPFKGFYNHEDTRIIIQTSVQEKVKSHNLQKHWLDGK